MPILSSSTPAPPRPCTRTGAGSTSTPRTHPGSRPPASSRACPGRRTASTMLHRAALRPRQGRVLPRPRVEDVRGFQTRPGGIHSPLEHEPEAGKIEGPDPEGVPESGPRGLVAIKGVQDLGCSSQPARALFLKETGPVPQGNRARNSHGASDRNRTCNPLITNQLRYRCATLAHLALSREAS